MSMLMNAVRANAVGYAAASGLRVVWTKSFRPACDPHNNVIYLPKPEGILPYALKIIDVELGQAGGQIDAETLKRKAEKLTEDMMYGLMVHEIGHNRYTRVDDQKAAFEEWEGAPASAELQKTVHRLFNVLEDVAIEKKMGECLPGLRIRLKLLAEQFEKSGGWGGMNPDGEESPAEQVMTALMVTMRKSVLDHQMLYADSQDAGMAASLGWIWDEIKRISLDALAQASSNANVAAAKAIVKLLIENQDADQEPQVGDDDDEQGDQEESDGQGSSSNEKSDDQSEAGDDDGSDDADSESEGGSGEDQDGDTDQAGDDTDESEKGESESGDADESDDADGESDEGGQKADEGNGEEDGSDDGGKPGESEAEAKAIGKFCRDILGDDTDAMGEMTDAMESGFDQEAAEDAPDAEESSVVGQAVEEHMKQYECARAEVNGNVLANRINHLLMTRKQTPLQRRVSGTKVDKRVLAQVRFNPQIFRSNVQAKGVDTAVTVVLDVSSSTISRDAHGVPITSSMFEAAVGLIKACERHKVETSLLTFNTSYKWVKTEQQSAASIAKSILDFGGGTFTSGVLPVACERLITSKKARRIVFLITDGDVFNQEEFDEAVRFYRSRGLEFRVLHFGNSQEASSTFSAMPYRSVTNSDEVCDAIFGLLEEAI